MKKLTLEVFQRSDLIGKIYKAYQDALQREKKEKLTQAKQKAMFEKEERERTPTVWKKSNR